MPAASGRAWAHGRAARSIVDRPARLVVGAIVIILSELARHRSDVRPGPAVRRLRGPHRGRRRQLQRDRQHARELGRRSSSAGCRSASRFKAGLFNIGAQGQFLMGALGAVIVGRRRCASRRAIVAIPLALAVGMRLRRVLGLHPGRPQGDAGAHEVVTTIMLNFVAIAILAWAVSGPLSVEGSPRTRSPRTSGTPPSRSSSGGTATSGSSSRR